MELQVFAWRFALGSFLCTTLLLFAAAAVASAATSSSGYSVAQISVLMEIYNSTDGSKWRKSYLWGNGNPCLWYGVYCSDAENVSSLILIQNNLTGILPSSIGFLTTLTHLDLSLNTLSGMIPDTIGLLTSLVILDFFDNSLNGTIPDTIGSLTSINKLDISYNNLFGTIPSSIGSLGNLTNLVLSHNLLSGTIPHTFVFLTNLQDLYLSSNQSCVIGDCCPFNHTFKCYTPQTTYYNCSCQYPLCVENCTSTLDCSASQDFTNQPIPVPAPVPSSGQLVPTPEAETSPQTVNPIQPISIPEPFIPQMYQPIQPMPDSLTISKPEPPPLPLPPTPTPPFPVTEPQQQPPLPLPPEVPPPSPSPVPLPSPEPKQLCLMFTTVFINSTSPTNSSCSITPSTNSTLTLSNNTIYTVSSSTSTLSNMHLSLGSSTLIFQGSVTFTHSSINFTKHTSSLIQSNQNMTFEDTEIYIDAFYHRFNISGCTGLRNVTFYFAPPPDEGGGGGGGSYVPFLRTSCFNQYHNIEAKMGEASTTSSFCVILYNQAGNVLAASFDTVTERGGGGACGSQSGEGGGGGVDRKSAVVGGVVGGLLTLAVVIGIFGCWNWNRNMERQTKRLKMRTMRN